MFARIIQHNEKTTTLEIQTVDYMINIVENFRCMFTKTIQSTKRYKNINTRDQTTDVNEYCKIVSKYLSQHNT